jgi:diguanylate cyclase (GGDEF)-like protein
MRADYRAQQRIAARDTTLIAGVVALVAFPSWGLYDAVVIPDQAAAFIRVRLLFEAAIALAWLGLLWRRLGARWPEQMAFLLVALPEVAIAWMIPSTGERLAPYLLGLSLAIYASAFMIVWRWQLTALLVALTGATTAAFTLVHRPGLEAHQIATIVFYLATAGTLAIAAQVYRDQKGWQQFVTQAALESERRRNEVLVEELDQLSREDPLTAVGNRRAWEARLVGEFLRARRSGRTMSVIVCDFDHFKSVNDTYGHAVGDSVLRVGARLLAERVRTTDFVARLGGDEFGIVCPDTRLRDAEQLAWTLAIRSRSTDYAKDVAVTFSLGVAELQDDDATFDDLLHRADANLYQAKMRRDTVCCGTLTAT